MSAKGAGLFPDLARCPCGGGTLDKLIQPAILAVLAEGPLHGYKLAERLGRTPICGGRNPDASGIYRFLRAMEEKGLVASSWDLSHSGPARKQYRLTASGRKCLLHWTKTLEEYRQCITALLATARKAVAKETKRGRGASDARCASGGTP
jgi:DNA-binding PadR family transcriptional regulator